MHNATATKHEFLGITPSTDGDLGTLKGLRAVESLYIALEIANYSGSGTVDLYIDASPSDRLEDLKWENRAHMQLSGNGDQYIRIHEDGSGSSDGSDVPVGSVRSGPIGEAIKFRATLAGTVTSCDIIFRIYRSC